MMSSSRHISRPRPSLSCEACRRRKVRCGREQPKCQSCQKTNETCVYNYIVSKEAVRQPHQPTIDSSPLFDITTIIENGQSNSKLPAVLVIGENPVRRASNAQSYQPLSTDTPSQPQDPAIENSLPFAGPDAANTSPIIAGYLENDNTSRPRYAENSFWALLHAQKSQSDKFLDVMYGPSQIPTLWTVNPLGLANLLKAIPNQDVCDCFLYSFLVCVRPVYPIVYGPTFGTDYSNFWHFCRHSDTLSPDQRLIDDPTFIPLLLSVLYCGAVTAPKSYWSSAPPLVGLDNSNVIESLRKSYLEGLELCQHPRRPTLNTLVASLLGYRFSQKNDEPFENMAFLDMAIRIAQSMGLHREHSVASFNPVEREMRRRIWWHVVSLDTEYSLRFGSQTSCGTEGNQWNVQMVSEATDEALSEFQSNVPTSTPSSTISAFMLLSIGRHETTRFMHGLLNQVNNNIYRLNQHDFNLFISNFNKLHAKLTELIPRIPAQGVPGFVSSRVANSSMSTNESLNTDQSEQPSAFSSWTRIFLSMLISSSLLGLQKTLLGHFDLKLEQSELLWSSTFRLSINIIRHILRITQIPEFASYFWYLKSHDTQTQQAAFLILSYLNHNSLCQDAQMACSLLDEVLDFYTAIDEPDPQLAPEQDKKSSTWQIIKKMRMALHVPNLQDSATPCSMSFISGCNISMPVYSNQPVAKSASVSTTNPKQTSRMEFSQSNIRLNLSQLEYWSSVVLHGQEDHSMTEIV